MDALAARTGTNSTSRASTTRRYAPVTFANGTTRSSCPRRRPSSFAMGIRRASCRPNMSVASPKRGLPLSGPSWKRGTLICLDQAGGLAIEEFKLPLRDTAHEIGNDEFFCPGSILRIELDPLNPLSYGMNPHTAGFFAFSSAVPDRPRAECRGAGSWRIGSQGSNHRAIRAPEPAGQRVDRGGIRDRRPACRRGSEPRRGPHRAARIPRPAPRAVARNVPPPVQFDFHRKLGACLSNPNTLLD